MWDSLSSSILTKKPPRYCECVYEEIKLHRFRELIAVRLQGEWIALVEEVDCIALRIRRVNCACWKSWLHCAEDKSELRLLKELTALRWEQEEWIALVERVDFIVLRTRVNCACWKSWLHCAENKKSELRVLKELSDHVNEETYVLLNVIKTCEDEGENFLRNSLQARIKLQRFECIWAAAKKIMREARD
jgi:hypothetical protein